MGMTFVVANLTKRQFFYPLDVWTPELDTFALLLTLDLNLDFHLSPWIGDCFFFVGDKDDYQVPQGLIDLRRHPDESPWWTVKNQFTDVSLNLIAQKCTKPRLLDYFLERASSDSFTFVQFAHIIQYLDAPKLKSSFEHRFGNEWRKRYQSILTESPWYFQRPMVPREGI